MRKSIDVEVSPGAILRRYSPKESARLGKEWLTTFGAAGAPNTDAYMWHVMSFQSYPNVSLKEATAQYELQVAPSFVILSNERDKAVETDQRPASCSESDFLVFPPNMAWTMAFTHEDGWLGPYFAKHRQYEMLNLENVQKIEKLQAVQRARKKGWL